MEGWVRTDIFFPRIETQKIWSGWKSSPDKVRPDLGSLSHNRSSSHPSQSCTPGTRIIILRTFWPLQRVILLSFLSESGHTLSLERTLTTGFSIVQTANGPTIDFKSETALRYPFRKTNESLSNAYRR